MERVAQDWVLAVGFTNAGATQTCLRSLHEREKLHIDLPLSGLYWIMEKKM